jgi:hypothetical protein
MNAADKSTLAMINAIRCHHCGEVIWFDPEFTVHDEDGEWLSQESENICEANKNDFSHEPETLIMRKYTEQEIADINRRARECARRVIVDREPQPLPAIVKARIIGILLGIPTGVALGYSIANWVQ